MQRDEDNGRASALAYYIKISKYKMCAIMNVARRGLTKDADKSGTEAFDTAISGALKISTKGRERYS